MLQLDNRTPFEAMLALFPDESGVDSVSPILKATFDISGELRVADDQLPLITADEYLGEPGESSIVRASEYCSFKPATDVLLIGHAYAPAGRSATELDVGLLVDGNGMTIRVFGDREWRNGFFGESISEPVPFEKIPLVHERAFGGVDVTKKGDPLGFEYNPVGTGFRHRKGTRRPEGMKLPNLEDPQNLIRRSNDKPMPASCAPICASWLPRLQYAGTYDEVWQKERAPYLPNDFDTRFNNVAQPGLTFSPYLRGGEQVDVSNASPESRLQFKLPPLDVLVTLRIEGSDQSVPVNLDTVCIEPDDARLSMIWRGRLNCDKRMLKMELATFEIGNTDHGVKGVK